MIDNKLRKAIENYSKEYDTEVVILDNPSFDHSVIGITLEGRLVYDFDKMINELAFDDDIDETEAQEFIEYNTFRALPYMGENTPIILNYDKKNLLNFFSPSDAEKDVKLS